MPKEPVCEICKKKLILIYGDQIEPFYIHPVSFCNGSTSGWALHEEEPHMAEIFANKYPVSEAVKKRINEPSEHNLFIEKVKNFFSRK